MYLRRHHVFGIAVDLILLRSARHDAVDDDLVGNGRLGAVSESMEMRLHGRRIGLAELERQDAGVAPERIGDEAVGTGHTRQSAADLRHLVHIFHVSDFDCIAANPFGRRQRDGRRLVAPQRQLPAAVPVKVFGGAYYLLRLGAVGPRHIARRAVQRSQQALLGRIEFECVVRFRVTGMGRFHIPVIADDPVIAGRQLYRAAFPSREFVLHRAASLFGEEPDIHTFGIRFGQPRPVEKHTHETRMRMLVAEFLVFARRRRQQSENHPEAHDPFHRAPPFSPLRPRHGSHTSEISAFVGPNQRSRCVDCQT